MLLAFLDGNADRHKAQSLTISFQSKLSIPYRDATSPPEAVIREADARPQEASFWQAVSDCIAQQLAVIEGAPPAD
jgi:hypothetical protein